jgi:hypothetical protein
MGRRQVAAVALLVVVLLAVCCGGSYLIGKSVELKAAPQAPVTAAALPAVTAAAAPSAANANSGPSADLPPASVASAQPAAAERAGAAPAAFPAPVSQSTASNIQRARQASAGAAPQAPLFADPVPGAIYIQTGAVEKGVATVLAEGLRTHGLDGFVAPGPTGTIFRVLIGPFHNEQGYKQARETVDSIGLQNFARRYQP